jgi:hypothetical protein
MGIRHTTGGRPLDQSQFNKDVATHQMTVHRSVGVYRHLSFGIPGSSVMRFDVITWPGYLAFTGDMGTYVFRRLKDMFEFFRHDAPNFDYWSEKVEAEDRISAVREFDAAEFRAVIYDEWKQSREDYTHAERRAISAELREMLEGFDGSEEAAYQALSDFECHGYSFHDLGDYDFKIFTLRFRWCCYALVWAIKVFDALNVDAPSKLDKMCDEVGC